MVCTRRAQELLEEISPITDHHKKMELSIFDPRFDEPWTRMPKGEEQERAKLDPRIAEIYCRERDITYAAPLRVSARLVMQRNRRNQGNRAGRHLPRRFPDDDAPTAPSSSTAPSASSFRSWCARRASISNATPDPATGKLLSTAKLIPNRGAWLEFETSNRDVLSVKVDRKRKMPVTILLRAIGIESDDELRGAFAEVDTNADRRYIQTTIEKEPTKTREEALIELYRRLRPGDPPTRDNATRCWRISSSTIAATISRASAATS